MSGPEDSAALADSDLADQRGEALPTRELMSLLSPTTGSGLLPGLAGTDTSTTPTTTPGADTAATGTSTAHDASQFTPPPSTGTYSPSATSSSTTS
ncbi:MAG: hypothetical protein NVSMB13_03570 [Mycobacteriales bacterium]